MKTVRLVMLNTQERRVFAAAAASLDILFPPETVPADDVRRRVVRSLTNLEPLTVARLIAAKNILVELSEVVEAQTHPETWAPTSAMEQQLTPVLVEARTVQLAEVRAAVTLIDEALTHVDQVRDDPRAYVEKYQGL